MTPSAGVTPGHRVNSTHLQSERRSWNRTRQMMNMEGTPSRLGTAGSGEHPSTTLLVTESRHRHAGVKLSILMPAFNEEQTISQAIAGVLATAYPCDFELIVVDDGSSD